MKLTALILLLSLASPGIWAQPSPEAAPAQKFSFSAGDADLRDVLRVAAKDGMVNLTFEPGLDTRVQGLELREMTFDEILTQVLPAYGVAVTRVGRTLHVHRSDGGMRFYPVDFLALRRQGNKSFTVNASGQAMQGGGGGQGGGSMGGGMQGGGQGGQQGGGSSSGNSAAFTSSLMTGSASDPWKEMQTGLSLMVFGEVLQPKDSGASLGSGSMGNIQAPTSQGFNKDGKSLLIQPDAGLIAVGADPAIQRRVESYLAEMKKRYRRQVLLEARIVEVTLGKESQMGTDWNAVLSKGTASGGVGTDVTSNLKTGVPGDALLQPGEGLFQLVAKNMRVSATISALARDGKLQVLSNPRIATLNNQKAILRVVREEAYFLQNSQITPGGVGGNIATIQITPMVVPVGIILDIQPQIGEDGTITLAVNPSVSEVASIATFRTTDAYGATTASASLPVVDRRDLDTVVKLRNGETLVLAGIIRNKEIKDDRGVPWFRKLPILGYLFSRKEESRQKTELAIFITPTLIEDAEQVDKERQRTEDRLKAATTEPKGTKSVTK